MEPAPTGRGQLAAFPVDLGTAIQGTAADQAVRL